MPPILYFLFCLTSGQEPATVSSSALDEATFCKDEACYVRGHHSVETTLNDKNDIDLADLYYEGDHVLLYKEGIPHLDVLGPKSDIRAYRYWRSESLLSRNVGVIHEVDTLAEPLLREVQLCYQTTVFDVEDGQASSRSFQRCIPIPASTQSMSECVRTSLYLDLESLTLGGPFSLNPLDLQNEVSFLDCPLCQRRCACSQLHPNYRWVRTMTDHAKTIYQSLREVSRLMVESKLVDVSQLDIIQEDCDDGFCEGCDQNLFRPTHHVYFLLVNGSLGDSFQCKAVDDKKIANTKSLTGYDCTGLRSSLIAPLRTGFSVHRLLSLDLLPLKKLLEHMSMKYHALGPMVLAMLNEHYSSTTLTLITQLVKLQNLRALEGLWEELNAERDYSYELVLMTQDFLRLEKIYGNSEKCPDIYMPCRKDPSYLKNSDKFEEYHKLGRQQVLAEQEVEIMELALVEEEQKLDERAKALTASADKIENLIKDYNFKKVVIISDVEPFQLPEFFRLNMAGTTATDLEILESRTRAFQVTQQLNETLINLPDLWYDKTPTQVLTVMNTILTSETNPDVSFFNVFFDEVRNLVTMIKAEATFINGRDSEKLVTVELLDGNAIIQGIIDFSSLLEAYDDAKKNLDIATDVVKDWVRFGLNPHHHDKDLMFDRELLSKELVNWVRETLMGARLHLIQETNENLVRLIRYEAPPLKDHPYQCLLTKLADISQITKNVSGKAFKNKFSIETSATRSCTTEDVGTRLEFLRCDSD